MMDMSSCPALEIDWGVSADLSDSDYDADDFDEELQSLYFSDCVPKLQFRKDVSVARWDGKKGMAEVIVRKGRMWSTTGIVRKEKLFCHIEEIMFMAEHGALLMLEGDASLSMEDIYSLLAEENYGCTWDYYQAYCHLKGLGYIVGRHNCPWTLKSDEYKPMPCCLSSSEDQGHNYEDDAISVDLSKGNNCFRSNSTLSTSEDKQMFLKDGECSSTFLQATSCIHSSSRVEESLSLSCALENLSISKGSSDSEHHQQGLKLVFDVYLPNTKFKKSAPGIPEFILCIARDCPPNKNEVQALQLLCGKVPLKFASAECGRVSFFSFDSVKLPVLP